MAPCCSSHSSISIIFFDQKSVVHQPIVCGWNAQNNRSRESGEEESRERERKTTCCSSTRCRQCTFFFLDDEENENKQAMKTNEFILWTIRDKQTEHRRWAKRERPEADRIHYSVLVQTILFNALSLFSLASWSSLPGTHVLNTFPSSPATKKHLKSTTVLLSVYSIRFFPFFSLFISMIIMFIASCVCVAQMKTSRQSFFFVFIVVSRIWKEIVVDMRKLERILFQKSLETRNNKPLWYLISCQFFIQTKFQQLRGIHRAFWLIWWNSSSARSRTAIIDILYGSEFRCLFSHFLFYSFLLFFLCQHKYMRPKNAFG